MAVVAETIEETRQQWREIGEDLLDPHVELIAEEFAALLSVYKRLRAAGETFDPMLMALMAVLERQAIDTDDGDGEKDQADDEDTEQRATTYPTSTVTSDACLVAMLERREQERRWG